MSGIKEFLQTNLIFFENCIPEETIFLLHKNRLWCFQEGTYRSGVMTQNRALRRRFCHYFHLSLLRDTIFFIPTLNITVPRSRRVRKSALQERELKIICRRGSAPRGNLKGDWKKLKDEKPAQVCSLKNHYYNFLLLRARGRRRRRCCPPNRRLIKKRESRGPRDSPEDGEISPESRNGKSGERRALLFHTFRNIS